MANFQQKQTSSRLGRSIVTNVATAQVNASQTTTAIGTGIYQARYVATLATWISIGTSTGTATAASDTYVPANTVEYLTVTPGQCLSFISTSTSTGYVSLTEMS